LNTVALDAGAVLAAGEDRRERGTIVWRSLLAERPPGPISTRVVHVDEVAGN
jgi:hypothetical protein